MLDKEKNKGDYQPYVANVNVRWGEFDLSDLSEMRFEAHEQERYGIKYGDIIVCEGGEPGRCAIWKEQIPNMKIQKALHRIRTHDCLDYRYLFYWFFYSGKRGVFEQYITGATIKHLPGDKLKSIIIDMPPLVYQKRIADILSAYDNLIENNQKQIKLLEEAAQRLYKEWFVDLRFPGHETTPIVAGVPEGWKKKMLIALFHKTDPFYCNTNDFTPEEADKQYLVNNGDIVVGMDGEFHINTWCGETSYLVQRTCRIKPKQKKLTGWLLQAIYSPIKYFEQTIVGATVAHLGKKHLDAIEILIGTDDLFVPFQILYLKRQKLLNQINKLSETRDRLLPKLMNGEIEV